MLKGISHALGFAEAGRCCPYLLRPEILSSVLYKTVEYSEWTGLLGRKSSPVKPQKRKYSTSAQGTLDQVEAIALLRAFDPGAWVRIAFDVKTVASNLRGEPFVKSVLQTGQTPQLMVARTFSDLNNCLVSTVMEHIGDFLRRSFSIDVPPDYLSVHLPHGIPLPGHYSLLELIFLCDIVDGDLMAFREQRTLLLLAGMYHCPATGAHI